MGNRWITGRIGTLFVSSQLSTLTAYASRSVKKERSKLEPQSAFVSTAPLE
jgi:hypothetical protein